MQGEPSRKPFAPTRTHLLEGGLAPAARFATAPPPPSAGSLRAILEGGLAPAARFATAPPPPSACSLRSKGALPPRLASRPLPRRLRRARSARRGPCPRGSLRDRSPAAFGVLAPLAGGLAPAARFATAPPPPSACSLRSKGALPPRLASRPLPRRLRRARSARRGPCPRGSLRDRSPAAFGVLAPLAGGLAPAARFATAPPPPSACSLRSQGALPPRLASRPLPRRLRRARSARRGPCPRGSLRDRSPAAFGVLAPLAGGLAPAARFATAPPLAVAKSPQFCRLTTESERVAA